MQMIPKEWAGNRPADYPKPVATLSPQVNCTTCAYVPQCPVKGNQGTLCQAHVSLGAEQRTIPGRKVQCNT